MTDVMLSLFKGQLESECVKIGAENELTQRGSQLIWWYFTRLHSFDAYRVEEVFCDGSGDLGIDALWIDDDDIVHFFQFKNPVDPENEIPAGEIDRLISGLRLIIERKHEQIANPELKERVAEIYQTVPSGYRIHIVTSGKGIPHEASVKLTALVDSFGSKLFSWVLEALPHLQQRFYTRNLPAVEMPIVFSTDVPPYVVRSGLADCYFFTAPGTVLAQLYSEHKEGLLQRNIRVDQGDTTTNRSIQQACSSSGSENFLHYNNGITFICRTAMYDNVTRKMRLVGSQIVNGGQTIRALHRANTKGTLRENVVVSIRAITGSDDKDFANDVAVNQNNQNRMGPGFLRSTHPHIVQLDQSLASLGWLLERRDGEVDAYTPEEKERAERRIGCPLNGRVIRMKDGLQAYAATFFEDPELAKKNSSLIFLSAEDGGYFDKVFNGLTAPKVIAAHKVKLVIDDFVKRFAAKKRRKDRVADWKEDYATLLGDEMVASFADKVDQMIPQSGIFLCGTLYQECVNILEKDPVTLPLQLEDNGDQTIIRHILGILKFVRDNPKIAAAKSWPSLLKSQSFFNSYCASMRT